jgi:antitoxin component of MazEF toxin-antitoxin module
MQTQIVAIGNSYGLRLPKPVLEALNLEKTSQLSIQLRNGSIVLRPIPKPANPVPREGWFDHVKVGHGEDAAIDEDWKALDAAGLNEPTLDEEWQW